MSKLLFTLNVNVSVVVSLVIVSPAPDIKFSVSEMLSADTGCRVAPSTTMYLNVGLAGARLVMVTIPVPSPVTPI